MYKSLGFKWLFENLFTLPLPAGASAFATADSDEARNPQLFIHVTNGFCRFCVFVLLLALAVYK
jgi:hypothetical protein